MGESPLRQQRALELSQPTSGALTISNYSRISHAAHSEIAVLVVRVRHQGATSFELVPHSPTESLEMVEWLTP